MSARSPILTAAAELALERRDALDDDCCVFAYRILERVAGRKLDLAGLALANVHPDLPGGRVSAARAWGPVHAAASLGIVRWPSIPPAVVRLEVGRWHIVQGWATVDPDGGVTPADGDRGHTWLWYAATLEHGVSVDSSRLRGQSVEMRPWAHKAGRFTANGHRGIAVGCLEVA